MNRTFFVDPARPEEAAPALEAAAGSVESGGLVVLPTETVYGIGARPDQPDATARLFRAKRRPPGLSLPVLAPTKEAAWTVARPDAAADALASACWPGPLTLVLPRMELSDRWALGDRIDTIGVRVPDHPLMAALLLRVGPLATTSANLSGRPPLDDGAALQEAFGSSVDVFLILAPGAERPAGRPSTVVASSRGRVRILRSGALVPDRLREALRESGLQVQWVDFE